MPLNIDAPGGDAVNDNLNRQQFSSESPLITLWWDCFRANVIRWNGAAAAELQNSSF